MRQHRHAMPWIDAMPSIDGCYAMDRCHAIDGCYCHATWPCACDGCDGWMDAMDRWRLCHGWMPCHR